MKKLLLITIVLLAMSLLLLSCDKSTEPVQPKSHYNAIKIENKEMILHVCCLPYSGVGVFIDFAITLENINTEHEFYGLDLLIKYDPTVMQFTSATIGDMPDICEWEYFTYRYSGPEGMVRLVAMSETNNGPAHPVCYSSDEYTGLAVLTFFVSLDNLIEDTHYPIDFYWLDCGDNTLSSRNQDTLFMADSVFNYSKNDSSLTWEVIESADGFPNYSGIISDCLDSTHNLEPKPSLNFYNGGIDIYVKKIPGDINVNGIPNEVADAVMFAHYFLYGESVFRDHVQTSIIESDNNYNNVFLEVADLVYLTRIIVGDALPWSSLQPITDTCTVGRQGDLCNYTCPIDIGAMHLRFLVNGTVGTPTVTDNMDVISNVSNDTLDVLVYNIGNEYFPSGNQEEFLDLSISGSVELISAEVSSYDGVNIPVVIQ